MTNTSTLHNRPQTRSPLAETDLLERTLPKDAIVAATGSRATLQLRPFQIVTLRVKRVQS